MDENYKFSSYNLTSGLFYQYDNNTFASHSQLSIYLANEFTDNEISHAHNSCLGVICYWITEEFHIHDLTLDIIKMGVYKTANDIVETIKPILEKFAAVTQLLTRLSISKPIANIFCAAYTLQLSVEAGLELREVQIRVGILKANMVDVISDIETRWNSTYMALKRLANLERLIK
ncbi:4324_t:CDS:2 [Cetraspora pellucida]|uniref:4324_t:CDS:1 n=1 Tax=Cetraspora pellucida TaxID=1433469 RepID=A0A9N9GVI9_9GLOM|nr:4324_t:CDS:2 [Cetraspora pellucida]